MNLAQISITVLSTLYKFTWQLSQPFCELLEGKVHVLLILFLMSIIWQTFSNVDLNNFYLTFYISNSFIFPNKTKTWIKMIKHKNKNENKK